MIKKIAIFVLFGFVFICYGQGTPLTLPHTETVVCAAGSAKPCGSVGHVLTIDNHYEVSATGVIDSVTWPCGCNPERAQACMRVGFYPLQVILMVDRQGNNLSNSYNVGPVVLSPGQHMIDIDCYGTQVWSGCGCGGDWGISANYTYTLIAACPNTSKCQTYHCDLCDQTVCSVHKQHYSGVVRHSFYEVPGVGSGEMPIEHTHCSNSQQLIDAWMAAAQPRYCQECHNNYCPLCPHMCGDSVCPNTPYCVSQTCELCGGTFCSVHSFHLCSNLDGAGAFLGDGLVSVQTSVVGMAQVDVTLNSVPPDLSDIESSLSVIQGKSYELVSGQVEGNLLLSSLDNKSGQLLSGQSTANQALSDIDSKAGELVSGQSTANQALSDIDSKAGELVSGQATANQALLDIDSKAGELVSGQASFHDSFLLTHHLVEAYLPDSAEIIGNIDEVVVDLANKLIDYVTSGERLSQSDLMQLSSKLDELHQLQSLDSQVFQNMDSHIADLLATNQELVEGGLVNGYYIMSTAEGIQLIKQTSRAQLEHLAAAVDVMTNTYPDLFSETSSALLSLEGATSSGFSGVQSGISSLEGATSSGFSGVQSGISSLQGAMSSGLSGVQSGISSLEGATSSGFSGVQSGISSLEGATSSGLFGVQSGISSLEGATSSGFSGVQSGISSLEGATSSGFSSLEGAVNDAFSGFESVLSSTDGVIRQGFTDVSSGFSSIAGVSSSGFSGVQSSLGSLESVTADGFLNTLSHLNNIGQSLSDGFADLLPAHTRLDASVNSGFDRVASGFESLEGVSSDGFSSMTSGFVSLENLVSQGLVSLVDGVYGLRSDVNSQFGYLLEDLDFHRDIISSILAAINEHNLGTLEIGDSVIALQDLVNQTNRVLVMNHQEGIVRIVALEDLQRDANAVITTIRDEFGSFKVANLAKFDDVNENFDLTNQLLETINQSILGIPEIPEPDFSGLQGSLNSIDSKTYDYRLPLDLINLNITGLRSDLHSDLSGIGSSVVDLGSEISDAGQGVETAIESLGDDIGGYFDNLIENSGNNFMDLKDNQLEQLDELKSIGDDVSEILEELQDGTLTITQFEFNKIPVEYDNDYSGGELPLDSTRFRFSQLRDKILPSSSLFVVPSSDTVLEFTIPFPQGDMDFSINFLDERCNKLRQFCYYACTVLYCIGFVTLVFRCLRQY